MRTKFATQMGMRAPVKGWRQYAPVNTPILAERPLLPRRGARAGDERLDVARLGGSANELGHQGMLRREAHEGHAEEGVGPGREHGDGPLATLEREADLRAGAPADPVPLHRDHALGPPAQAVEVTQQLVGVRRDAEEPLLQLPVLDGSVAPPASPVHHLLVREDRPAGRAPVDDAALAVGEPALEHAQEEELLPAVVARVARRDLAIPVVRETEPAQLEAHVVDVVVRPAGGVRAVLDRRVLGRQAEGVPPDRMQDAEAGHAPLPRDHVTDRVVADVPHVDVSRRVREHLEDVVGGRARIRHGRERPLRRPALLPPPLDRLRLVARIPHAHSGGTALSLSRTPSTPAMWSRTPFTNDAESSLPKRRAISTASLRVTDAGISGRPSSS